MKTVVMFCVAAVLAVTTPALAGEGPGAYFEKGAALMEQGRYEEAVKVFELVAREWPDDAEFTPRAVVHAGECFARMGRLEDAIHRLEIAVTRYPDKHDLCQYAGKLLDETRAKLAAKRAEGGEARRPEGPPEGGGVPPQAQEKIQRHLAELEQKLRAEGWEDEGIRKALAEERRRLEREMRPPSSPEEKMARHMAEIERKLKEKGLAGEELERALAEEKARLKVEFTRPPAKAELKQPPADPREKLRRMVELWKEQGVPQEEIDARVANFEREMAMMERAKREVEEAKRRLTEEGLPPEEVKRRLEEMERARKAEAERGWREGREGDLEGARREFLKLAERLGIPREEAERFLADNARRRPFPPEGGRGPGGEQPGGGPPPGGMQPGGPQPGMQPGGPMPGAGDRVKALEERLERLERRLAELIEKMGK